MSVEIPWNDCSRIIVEALGKLRDFKVWGVCDYQIIT